MLHHVVTFDLKPDAPADQVEQIATALDALAASVGAINKRLDAMIQFKGDFFAGTRSDQSRIGFFDYSGAFRPASGSLFANVATPHEFHLETHANLPGGVRFNGDFVVSNYLSYRSPLVGPGIVLGGPSTANANGFPEQLSLYQANLQIPIGCIGRNTQLTVGRFKNQITPLTYYRTDTDAYFDIPWYDDGNFVQDGFRVTGQFGNVKTQLFAGSYTGLTTTLPGEFINRPFVGATNGPRFFGPAKPVDYPIIFNQGAGIANQSAGVHVDVPVFKYGELGLTLIDLSSTGVAPGGIGFPIVNPFSNVVIYGANVKLNPIGRFLFNAEASKSVTQLSIDKGDGRNNDDNNAFNLNLGYNSGPIGVQAGYQYIDPRFSAPGYWNKIGNWYNPTNVQGPFIKANYNFGHGISANVGGDFLSGARNRSVNFGGTVNGGLSVDDDINRILAGLKWGATKNLNFSLDWEGVFFDLSAKSSAIGVKSHPQEQYITIGAGVKLSGNTEVKAAYQIGALQNGGGFGGLGPGGNRSNFSVFTTQVAVRF